MDIDVSVIIVNYNCDALLGDCIRSVYRQTSGIRFEIIVADNDSTDESIKHVRASFPEVVVVENGKNLGFGAANNAGAKVAKGKYLLLLNPDTILINNAIKILHDAASAHTDGMGCCGGNLVDEQMRPANLGGNFPSLFQLFSDIGFRMLYKGFYKRKVSLLLTTDTLPHDLSIDCICGADLMISRERFEQVGGFDEDYFLYFEDTDLCYRLKKAGYRNFIVPEATIQHLESAAIADNRTEKLNLRKFTFFEKSKQLFFRKAYGRQTLVWVKLFTIGYILSRMVAHRAKPSNYFKMIDITLKTRS